MSIELLRETIRGLILSEARVIQDNVPGAEVYRAWTLTKWEKERLAYFDTGNILLAEPFTSSPYIQDGIVSPKITDEKLGTPGSSLLVDIPKKLIDLSMLAARYQTRRPNKTGNKTYTIPHGDVSFKNAISLAKTLKAVMTHDPRVTGDFSIVGNPSYNGQTVSDVIGAPRVGDQMVQGGDVKPLTMYHGTSAKRWETIKREGLRPGKVPEVYSDLIPGYSDFNVYLSTSVSTAENYASRAAVDDKSTAVVLKVIVRDPDRLVIDEDTAHWMDVTGPNGEEKEVHFKHDYWRKWDNAEQIMSKFQSKIAKALNSIGDVAYKGRIPTRDISVHSTYKPASMKKDPSWDEFTSARDKTMSTYALGDKTTKSKKK